jgi:hypothetical protein
MAPEFRVPGTLSLKRRKSEPMPAAPMRLAQLVRATGLEWAVRLTAALCAFLEDEMAALKA